MTALLVVIFPVKYEVMPVLATLLTTKPPLALIVTPVPLDKLAPMTNSLLAPGLTTN